MVEFLLSLDKIIILEAKFIAVLVSCSILDRLHSKKRAFGN
jgi:hypothetical protein